MNEAIIKDAKFEELRDGVKVELFHANQCLENYNELDCATRKLNTNAKRFYHFFLYTKRAFYNCFINSTFNVIHHDHSTYNFCRLLNYVKSNSRLSQLYDASFWKDIRDFIEDGKNKNIIERIETERHKFISHNEYPSNKFKTTVSFAEARKFIDTLLSMLDKISDKYDGTQYELYLQFLSAKSLLQELDRVPNERATIEQNRLKARVNQP